MKKLKHKNIISILEDKNAINNCTFICELRNQLIIEENNICIDECSEDEYYKYKYNNKCYSKCPEGTKSFSSDNICVDYIETTTPINILETTIVATENINEIKTATTLNQDINNRYNKWEYKINFRKYYKF